MEPEQPPRPRRGTIKATANGQPADLGELVQNAYRDGKLVTEVEVVVDLSDEGEASDPRA